MNPLPPQAYTKETLAKAYHWLQSQSESIKELATNPDILVSLYLKAKLNGDAALERPSIQNFKNELKNLAGMMGEFEGKEPLSSPSTLSTTGNLATKLSVAPSPTLNPGSSPSQNKQEPIPEKLAAEKASTGASNLEFDPKSLAMIQEVKELCNLSSDQEALRMLVAIGYRKVQSLTE